MGTNYDKILAHREKREKERPNLSSSNYSKILQHRLEKDYESTNKAINDSLTSWQDKDTMSATKLKAKNYYDALSSLYGESMSDEQKKNLGAYESVLNQLNDRERLYSQFINADAFNKARAKQETAEKYRGLSYDALQKKLATVTDKDEQKYLKGYTDFKSLEDFDRAIAAEQAIEDEYKAKGRKAESAYKKSLTEARNRFEAAHRYDKYAALKSNTDFEENSDPTQILNAEQGMDADFYLANKDLFDRGVLSGSFNAVRLSDMDEEMQRMGAYILKKKGNEAYLDYMRNMTDYVRNQQADNLRDVWSGYAEEHPALTTIGSTLLNPVVGGLAGVDQALSNLSGHRGVSQLSGLSSAMSSATAEISQKIKQENGTLPAFAYDVFTTGVPNRIGQMMFGGAYNVVMGMSSFANTYANAIQQGQDPDRAVRDSFVAGAIEFLTEQLGMEWAFGTSKSLMTTILKQAFAEGSEEVVGAMAQAVWDAGVNGADSEFRQNVAKYREMGYEYSEAESMARADFAKDVAYQFAVAAASTAPTGGVQAMRTAAQGSHIDADALRNYLQVNPTADELGLLEKYNEEFGKVSNWQKGEAYRAASEEIKGRKAKTSKDVQKAIEDRITLLASYQPKDKDLKKKFNLGEKSEDSEGNSINVEKVSLKDGKTIIESNGDEYDAKEVTLSENDAYIVSRASEIKNDALRDLYVNNYHGQDIATYDAAFELAVNHGTYGTDKARVLDMISTETMPQSVVNDIYDIARYEDAQKAIASREANTALLNKWDGKYKKGVLDTSALDMKNLSREQKRVVDFLKVFSTLGMNIRVINDEKTNIGGDTDTKSGDITINLAAKPFIGYSTKGGRYAVNTFAHETTHFMQVVLGDEFKLFESQIKEYLGSEWDVLVSKRMEGHNISEKEAQDEVIARFCENFRIGNEEAENFLTNMEEKPFKRLMNAIRNWFKKVIADINEWMKGVDSDSPEAMYAKLIESDFKKFEKEWVGLFERALQKKQALADANIELVDGVIYDNFVYSIATKDESWIGTSSAKDQEKAARILYDSINERRKENPSILPFTLEDCKRAVKDINNKAFTAAKLQYIDTGLSTLNLNDPEYKNGVFDFSNVCPKRLAYTGTLAKIHDITQDAVTFTELIALRKFLMDAGYDAPCTFCYVEGKRGHMDDLVKEFLEKNPQYGLTLAQLTNAQTLEDLRQESLAGKDNGWDAFEKFMNKKGSYKPKALEMRRGYRGEILDRPMFKGSEEKVKKAVAAFNRFHGGFRFFAFSDFEVPHMLDVMQVIFDMSRKGLHGFAYTKQLAFADIFGDTGLKIDISCVAKGVDKNGNLIFDDVEGANHEEAMKIRAKHNDVGIVCVVFNEEQFKAALLNDNVDYILPFHASGVAQEYWDFMGLPENTKDYTKEQTEKVGDETTEKTGENISIMDIWDYNLSPRENAQKYLDIINERGGTPLFRSILNHEGGEEILTKDKKNPKHKAWKGGKWVLPEGAIGDNYYKCLVEWRMYDNNGNPAPQRPVLPEFNMQAANKAIEDYINDPNADTNSYPVVDEAVEGFLKWKEAGEPREWSENGRKIFSQAISDETYEQMKEHFGTTENMNVAGYMLKDGTLLDFSGKHWGDTTSTTRTVDHRDIQEVLPDDDNGFLSVQRMRADGNIRLEPEIGGINLAVEPTKKQYEYLQDYISYMLFKRDSEGVVVDFSSADDEYGNRVKALYYEPNTNPKQVLNDIRNYFQGKEASDIAKFHTMYSEAVSDEEYSKLAKENPEEARKVLERVAREHGYNSPMLFHGTTEHGFNVFNRKKANQGIFLTTSDEVAYSYAETYEIATSEENRFDLDKASFDDLIRYNNDEYRHSDIYKIIQPKQLKKKIKDWQASLKEHADRIRKIDKETIERIYNAAREKDEHREERIPKLVKRINKVADLYDRLAADSVTAKDVSEIGNELEDAIFDVRTLATQYTEMAIVLAMDVTEVARTIARLRIDKEAFEQNVPLATDGDTYYTEEGLRQGLKIRRQPSSNGIYPLYARLGKHLSIDGRGNYFDATPVPKEWQGELGKLAYIGELAEKAESEDYDSISVHNTYDMGQFAWDYFASDVYVVFDPRNVASADLITYDDAGNEIPLSQRFQGTGDLRYSEAIDEGDYGYHAGDLGKAEPLAQQGYRRDTGHYGTGTYFVGNEEKINIGGFKERPHEKVDFSKYKLFQARNDKVARDLHDFLKEIDGGIKEEWLPHIFNDDYSYINRSDVLDIGDDFSTSNLLKKYEAAAKKLDADYMGRTEYLEDYGYEDITDEGGYSRGEYKGEPYEYFYSSKELDDTYYEYLKKVVDKRIGELNAEYRKFMDRLFELKFYTSFNGWEDALKKVVEYQKHHKAGAYNGEYRSDSYATVFMKALGYEGVDTRGTSYDNTGYGSVIYDLKGEDLTRKQEIGTAKWSEAIDSETYKLLNENENLKKRETILEEDIKRLEKLVEMQGRVTKGLVIDRKKVEKIADAILKERESKYDKRDLTNALEKAYQDFNDILMDKGKITSRPRIGDEEVKKSLFGGVFRQFYDIADKVLSDTNTRAIDVSYKSIANEIRNAKVKFTEAEIAQAKEEFGNSWSGHFISRINLSQDGESLETLWNRWAEKYPHVFDKNEKNKVVALIDTYKYVKESQNILQNFNEQENLGALTEDIYNRFWGTTLETVADKYEAKIKDIKAEHKQAMSDLRTQRDKAIKRVRQHKNDVIKKVRADRDQKIRDLKQHYKDMDAKKKDEAIRRAEIKKIISMLKDFSNALKKNSIKDNNKVIKPLAGLVENFIASIDISSEQTLGMRGKEGVTKGVTTKQDAKLISALNRFGNFVTGEDLEKGLKEARDALGIGDDIGIDYIAQRWKSFVDRVIEISDERAEENTFVLYRMSTEDLKQLHQVLTILKKLVGEANQLIGSAYRQKISSLCLPDYEELRRLGKRKAQSPKMQKFLNFFNWDNLLPKYAMKHIGKGCEIIFEELADAQDKEGQKLKVLREWINKEFATKKAKDKGKLDGIENFGKLRDADEKAIHTAEMEITFPAEVFDEEKQTYTSGEKTKKVKFEISDAAIMSLHCLNQRGQAKMHINQGGVIVAPMIDEKGKEQLKSETIILQNKDVEYLESLLTNRDEQIKRAEKLQEFLSEWSKENVNEATMKMYGIEIADDDYYFPIDAVPEGTTNIREHQREEGIYKLLNSAFVNPLAEHPSNPILLHSIYEVFVKSTSETTKYNCYAPAIRDMIKYINYKSNIGKGEVISMRDAIEDAYGSKAYDYIVGFLKDLGGVKEKGRGEEYAGWMRNYKVAAVAANLQVALLQPVAITRAALVLPRKYLLKAMAMPWKIGKGIETMHEHSGVSLIKESSTFDVNLSRGLNRELSKQTVMDKVVEKSMSLAGKMDTITWATMWNACEAEYKAKHGAITKDSYEEINRRFREVIYDTQVMDSVMTRSALMRSQAVWAQMITSFMSEPIVSYNIIQDTAFNYNSDRRKFGKAEAFKRNGAKMAKAVEIYLVNVIVESVVRSIMTKYRKPDEDETPIETLWKEFLEQVNPINLIPIGRDVMSILQGYDVDRMDIAALKDIDKVFSKWGKIAEGEKSIDYKAIQQMLKLFSSITGIPVSNLTREVISAWNLTIGNADDSLKVE